MSFPEQKNDKTVKVSTEPLTSHFLNRPSPLRQPCPMGAGANAIPLCYKKSLSRYYCALAIGRNTGGAKRPERRGFLDLDRGTVSTDISRHAYSIFINAENPSLIEGLTLRVALKKLLPVWCLPAGCAVDCSGFHIIGSDEIRMAVSSLPGHGGAERLWSCASSRLSQPPKTTLQPEGGAVLNGRHEVYRPIPGAPLNHVFFQVSDCCVQSWSGLLSLPR